MCRKPTHFAPVSMWDSSLVPPLLFSLPPLLALPPFSVSDISRKLDHRLTCAASNTDSPVDPFSRREAAGIGECYVG